jgi:hypothetical protein
MTPAVVVVVAPDPVAPVLAAARETFESMLGELPYADRPAHAMFGSMFACAGMLAVFRVLRERGVDAHSWGRACHTLPPAVGESDEASREQARRDGEASRQDAAPNEFVFEIVEGDETTDRGMNITSCAICHLFGKYDAMDLVPYMCAYDDVVSDAGGQGLRRTGTIALGASHCDFRFRDGGEPLRLVDQYPDRIRLDPARTSGERR